MFKLVNKLGTGLNKASLRHTVLSNNLANVNTPGFKRSDVTMDTRFSQELIRIQNPSLTRTNIKHFSGTIKPEREPFMVIQDNATTMRNDENNVDPEREKVLLMENQIYYESLTDAVSRKLSQIRTVIGEGRR